ncbi:MAG TPA: hypothetical protein VNM37_19215 [Candidatus Dormibacteraeota bacterium]|nr:hypothetical protein [Candidatus Dormibacteraeota bacterium]
MIALDFQANQTIPAGWTFTRASVATDTLASDPAARAITDFAINAPRFRPEGLLLGLLRSNFLPNSANPGAVQVNSIGNLGQRAYMCWMLGTGSVTLANNTATSTDLPLTVTQGTPRVFTTQTSTGNIKATPSGQVLCWQMEQADAATFPAAPSSLIKTVAALVSRSPDALMYNSASWLNATAGTYVVELVPLNLNLSCVVCAAFLTANAAGDREQIFTNFTPSFGTMSANSITQAGVNNLGRIDASLVMSPGSVYRVGYTAGPNRRLISMNGSDPVTGGLLGPRSSAFDLFALMATNVQGQVQPGFLRKFYYWPNELSRPHLQSVTQLAWSP